MTARAATACDDATGRSLGLATEVATTRVNSDRLPIFRWDNVDYATFYAPGCLCVVGRANADQFEMTIGPAEPGVRSEPGVKNPGRRPGVLQRTHRVQRKKPVGAAAPKPSLAIPPPSKLAASWLFPVSWGAELWRRAGMAVAEAERRCEGPFEPECLTLYMSNECNLNCSYCHTDPSAQPANRLDLDVIAAAAKVVAEACREKAHPFYLVFHGGGEPTLHREQVENALVRVRAIAARYGVETFLYIATNGALSEADALWLAREFDLVGLSCDGPAEIHNVQRPRWDGSGSLHLVERAGRILREEGCRLHVRTTITRVSLAHQAEIAEFICQRFSPEEIHFEPVYLGGRTGPPAGLEARHASEFVTHFLAARSVAGGYGIPLLSSGSRPGSLHGPFCHLFRNVINLVPGSGPGQASAGVATACFKLTSGDTVREKGACIGELDRESGRFEIDAHRVQSLRRRLDVALPACDGCFNFYHCARECPDYCPLDGGSEQMPPIEPGFRCRVQKATASAILRETAARLWAEAKSRRDGKPHGTAIS